jgi:hypothetical protein
MPALPEGHLDVYVRLLDEGTIVYRPARAVSTGPNTAKLLAAPQYDAGDEHWEFAPGAHVRLERRRLGGDEVLVAVEHAGA